MAAEPSDAQQGFALKKDLADLYKLFYIITNKFIYFRQPCSFYECRKSLR